jgi:hypothetical protein
MNFVLEARLIIFYILAMFIIENSRRAWSSLCWIFQRSKAPVYCAPPALLGHIHLEATADQQQRTLPQLRSRAEGESDGIEVAQKRPETLEAGHRRDFVPGWLLQGSAGPRTKHREFSLPTGQGNLQDICQFGHTEAVLLCD